MSGKQLVGCVGFKETRQMHTNVQWVEHFLSRSDQNMTWSMAVDLQFL